jgi:hypothetical protein
MITMADSSVRRSSRIASKARSKNGLDEAVLSTSSESKANEAQDNVSPEDSVSQCGKSFATSSSINVRRLEISAKKAAILAEAALAEERQKLEWEEMRLQQRK